MITNSLLNAFFSVLQGIVDFIPSLPMAPNFDDSIIVGIVESAGYVLPIKAMIATFALTITLKNWNMAKNIASWIWERIPLN